MKTSAPTGLHFRLAPTDLVYLYDDCKRCFVDKVKNGLELPRSFSPRFTSADRAMRRALGTSEIVDVGVGPRFRVITQGEWVESRPISFPSHNVLLSFKGQLDALVVTEDEEVFVVDYKTTTQDDVALMRYRRQLMSYTVALEQPARPSTLPSFIDGMALLVFDPANFVFRKDSKVGGLYGKTRWVELPRRDDRFDAFLSGIAAILASDVLPLPEDACSICRLRFYTRVASSGTADAKRVERPTKTPMRPASPASGGVR